MIKYGWILAAMVYGGLMPVAWGDDTPLLVYASTETDELVLCNHCDQTDSPQPIPLHASYRLPLRQPLPYAQEVAHAAKTIRIDQALLHAVILTESGYRPQAVSVKGARGLMQVTPATARQFTSKPLQQLTANEQIEVGARYLQQLLRMFGGDLPLALAAYNAGPAAIQKHQGKIPPYAETQRYVPTVLNYYEQLKWQ